MTETLHLTTLEQPVPERFSRVVHTFLDLVRRNTQSADGTERHPSTEGQDLILTLIKERMEALGHECAQFEHGTVMVHIPASDNCQELPPVGWAAHVDTALDASGDVKPMIHTYSGGNVHLPHDDVIISESSPALQRLMVLGGGELITSDGTSLLGADDKAGVAALMELAHRLSEDPFPHPETYLFFCADEENEYGFGEDLPEEVMRRLSVFWTPDGTTMGTLDTVSARICRRLVHLSHAPQQTAFTHQLTLEFKGKSGHPGVSPELWRPAHVAASAAAFAIANVHEYGEVIVICNLEGGAAKAKLVLGLNEDEQLTGRIRDHVLEVLEAHEEVSVQFATVEPCDEVMEHPHLIPAAALCLKVHELFPVLSFRGESGNGYIIPAQLDPMKLDNADEPMTLLRLGTAEISEPYSEELNQRLERVIETQTGVDTTASTWMVEPQHLCQSVADAIAPRREVLDPMFAAMREFGLEVDERAVPGGTDGGMLNLRFPKLPAPNLGTGAEDIHCEQEHISVPDLELLANLVSFATRMYAQA